MIYNTHTHIYIDRYDRYLLFLGPALVTKKVFNKNSTDGHPSRRSLRPCPCRHGTCGSRRGRRKSRGARRKRDLVKLLELDGFFHGFLGNVREFMWILYGLYRIYGSFMELRMGIYTDHLVRFMRTPL